MADPAFNETNGPIELRRLQSITFVRAITTGSVPSAS